MAEKILSQEEIDALLSAMDKGEVDLDVDDEIPVDIRPYDLTSKSIMLHGQFDALEEMNDKFVGLMNKSISDTLLKHIEIEIVSTEVVRFSEFIKQFSTPTCFNKFTMEPLIGHGLVSIEPELVFSLIDCMFGGDGKPLDEIRDFTLIEQRMMLRFVNDLLKNLEAAWHIAYPVKIVLKKVENKPEFVNIVNPNDSLVVQIFSINGEKFSGNIHLSYAYLMLEPIKEKLSSSYIRNKDIENVFTDQIQALLSNTEIEMKADLGKTIYKVRDILNFEVDDVLKLKNGPPDDILLNVEGVPKFKVSPGIVKGNKAVQIKSLLHQKGEKGSHGGKQ